MNHVLVDRRRHEAQGIGRHDPFEVGGDVVALDGQDVPEFHLIGDREEVGARERRQAIVRLADIA
jgi:hypothetical protein